MNLPAIDGERLRLRPLDAQDLDRLAEIVAAPGVSEWWSPPDTPEAVREDLRNDGAAFGIEVDGDPRGLARVQRRDRPRLAGSGHRHLPGTVASGPRAGPRGAANGDRLAGGGARPAAVHDRPGGGNERAIAAYASVGFRPVGVMRNVERGADGSWHDNLLMDLLL